jgi:hypothetical protein
MGDIPGLCGPIRPEGMNKGECKFRLTGKQDTEDQVRVSSDRPTILLGVVSGWPRSSGSAFGFNSVTLYSSFAYSALACFQEP